MHLFLYIVKQGSVGTLGEGHKGVHPVKEGSPDPHSMSIDLKHYSTNSKHASIHDVRSWMSLYGGFNDGASKGREMGSTRIDDMAPPLLSL